MSELPRLDQLEATPTILRGLTAELDHEDVRWKPAPDRFSGGTWICFSTGSRAAGTSAVAIAIHNEDVIGNAKGSMAFRLSFQTGGRWHSRIPVSVTSDPRGYLVLEDGRVFGGTFFGARREARGEVVLHTGLTGYQEILIGPFYCGQIVTLTYPHSF